MIYLFLVLDPARIGKRVQFITNALHSADSILGVGCCVLFRVP